MCEDSQPPKRLWNSLEIAKLVVGALTPVAIFFFTYYTNQAQETATARKEDAARHESQRAERFSQITKQRVALWAQISPSMNDLYCYFLYVGHWKDLGPDDIIHEKRLLDKLIYSNSPFFTPDFIKKYNVFMGAAFRTGNAWGVDAQLRSPPIRPKDKSKEALFARESKGYVDNSQAIYDAYFGWLKFAADEMDLNVPPPEQPPKPKTPSEEDIQKLDAGTARGGS